jgi:hypothetical protein
MRSCNRNTSCTASFSTERISHRPQTNPIRLLTERKAGHSGGGTWIDWVEHSALVYGFVLQFTR